MVVAAVAVISLLAACRNAPAPGPQPSTEAATPASLLSLFATDTPTPAPTATPTSTPTTTPTPAAALAIAGAPVGEVLFSTARDGELGEQLWRLGQQPPAEEVSRGLWPNTWRCAPALQGLCIWLDTAGGLIDVPLSGRKPALLDDLSPISSTLPLPVLALDPQGSRLAVAARGQLALYDLQGPALLAVLDAPVVRDLAWSPDGSLLAWVAALEDRQAVVVWATDEEATALQPQVIAEMDAADHLAWSPDGQKLAFDAQQSAATPDSQGSRPDIFVYYRDSGEIANLTELFHANDGLGPTEQIAVWQPEWNAGGQALRYRRGRIEDPAGQEVWQQTPFTRDARLLWTQPDEGVLGMIPSPGGAWQARVLASEGRQTVQVRQFEQEWANAFSGTFAEVSAVIWSPLPAADEASAPSLLVVDRQTLWLVDPNQQQAAGLVVACNECRITHAVWRNDEE